MKDEEDFLKSIIGKTLSTSKLGLLGFSASPIRDTEKDFIMEKRL